MCTLLKSKKSAEANLVSGWSIVAGVDANRTNLVAIHIENSTLVLIITVMTATTKKKKA